MIAVERLQFALQENARCNHVSVPAGPLTLFLHHHDSSPGENFAFTPAAQALHPGALEALLAVGAARERCPALVCLGDPVPKLAWQIKQAGFYEFERCQVMVCTPESWRPAPQVDGLTFGVLSAASPLDEIKEGLNANAQGFDPAALLISDEQAEAFRKHLELGRALTARLDGQVVGAGLYTPIQDGLTQLKGITTLEPYRRRGIAAALTAVATRTAFEQGAQQVFLTAQPRATRILAPVGFQACTILHYFRRPAPSELFVVSEAWKAAYPGAAAGVLIMNGVSNPDQDQALERLKTDFENQLRARFAGQDRFSLAALPVLQAYDAYYRPYKQRYHVLFQLESVALKGKPIPSVAALVEAMFIAELKNLLLTAGHDLDQVHLPVRLDVAVGNESYTLLRGQDQTLKAEDMYMSDTEGVISSVLYGPDQRTQLNPGTRRALFTLYAPPGIGEQAVHQHLLDIQANVQLVAPQARVEHLQVYCAE